MESLRETPRSSERFYFALNGIKASINANKHRADRLAHVMPGRPFRAAHSEPALIDGKRATPRFRGKNHPYN